MPRAGLLLMKRLNQSARGSPAEKDALFMPLPLPTEPTFTARFETMLPRFRRLSVACSARKLSPPSLSLSLKLLGLFKQLALSVVARVFRRLRGIKRFDGPQANLERNPRRRSAFTCGVPVAGKSSVASGGE